MHRARYQILWLAPIFALTQARWGHAARAAEQVPTLVEATIASSLEAALWAKSPSEGRALAAEVARLWRAPSHRGDRLQLLYVPRAPAHEPQLLALRYLGRHQTAEAYRFAGDGGIGRFYDADGTCSEPRMRNPPVPGYEQITERVQRGRGRRRHAGDDLKAQEGSPVILPFAGQVLRTNWHRRHNGLCVEVLLDAGYTARFLHLASVDDRARRGAHLPAGSPLGQVGSTGRSTGPHLHYELLREGRPVEPLSVHGREVCALEGPELAQYLLLRTALRRQLVGLSAVGTDPPAAADAARRPPEDVRRGQRLSGGRPLPSASPGP